MLGEQGGDERREIERAAALVGLGRSEYRMLEKVRKHSHPGDRRALRRESEGAMIVYAAELYETMPRTKVGIREFRANLVSILESKTPVTVTRHGETLGVFVPVGARSTAPTLLRSRKPTKADIEAARLAGEEMDAMIAAAGTTAEELIADYENARREKPASRAQS
jgi:hypothetical protein